MDNKYDVAIVGGGAAGIVCAIECAKKGKKVVVFEVAERVGKKLLATGNGRCNLSNMSVSKDNYNNKFVQKIVEKYPCDKIVAYFESLGLLCKNEDGRIYPLSESANNVLSTLILQMQRYGVEVLCQVRIESIKKVKLSDNCNGKNNDCDKANANNDCDKANANNDEDYFFELVGGGQSWSAKNVVLACGSRATLGTESYNLGVELGHHMTQLKPSLVALPTKAFCGASGVRAKASAKLVVDGVVVTQKSGEFLFKDNALSGILAFELSSKLARMVEWKKASVVIDFAPNIDEEKFVEFLRENASAFDPLVGVLNKAIARIVLSRVVMDRSLIMTDGKCKNIAKACKNFEVEVTKPNSFANAQVCVGGLVVSEFDDQTLQSKLCKKLFACGEMLDIDGDCGGYNLHWAWASGLAVAQFIINC
ncbi:MAG: NAD(P)/FAD-dependent oxidoreductase [Clostridia bacterium]